MNTLTYLRECQNPSRWHFLRMLSRTFPSSVLLKPLMNTPSPPLEMGYSHTSTIHPTTISSSMLVLGMTQPIHQLLPREGMYMLLLVPRISPILRNLTKHSSLKTLTHHQMISIRYIKPNTVKSHLSHYWGFRGITTKSQPPLHPRSPLRNTMVLFMFLLKFTNSSGNHVTDIADHELPPSVHTTPE